MFDDGGAAAARLPAALSTASQTMLGRRPDPPPAGGRPLDGPAGHHVQRLRRPAGPRADHSVRHRAADHRQRGMGMARARPASSGSPRSTCSSTTSTTSRRSSATAWCPEHVVATATGFRKQCVGLKPPRGIWCHITGTDLVRDTRRPVLRARRQPALPVGRVVRAAEPAADEADVSAAVRADRRFGRSTTTAAGCSTRCSTCMGDHVAIAVGGAADARHATTRPTSSTRSWPSRWASTWSKAATWSCPTASSTCGPPRASSGST